MQIIRDTFKNTYKELLPVFKEHWSEVGMAGAEALEFKLDILHYLELEAQNKLFCVVLRTDTNKIAGYISFMIYNHHHHRDTRFAYTDCFYVRKDYRKTSGFKNIIKMFKYAESILKAEFKVSHIQFAYSVNNDLSMLAQRLGYSKSDILMVKRI